MHPATNFLTTSNPCNRNELEPHAGPSAFRCPPLIARLAHPASYCASLDIFAAVDTSQSLSAGAMGALGKETDQCARCFVRLEKARGAEVVSVVVVHDGGNEPDTDPETGQHHRPGDHRPPCVARSGSDQPQR